MPLWVGIVALILIVSITAGIAGVLLRGRENDIGRGLGIRQMEEMGADKDVIDK
ncbi:MAG: hypothetical protein MSA91_05775 [Lachnobacterium sp.]|nr:hypothetical protein [Lachnobacterium sp.]